MEAVNTAVTELFRCDVLPEDPVAFIGQRLLELRPAASAISVAGGAGRVKGHHQLA